MRVSTFTLVQEGKHHKQNGQQYDNNQADREGKNPAAWLWEQKTDKHELQLVSDMFLCCHCVVAHDTPVQLV